MRERSKHRSRLALYLLAAGAAAGMLASAAAQSPPPPAQSDILLLTRAVLADIQAFEHLNQELVKLCREPVKGSYADFRDDFKDDLARTRELERALGPTPAELAALAARPVEATLQPFRDAGEQDLYSRCLRWGTALIQHETRLRADIAAKFAFLKTNEAAIRAALPAKDK
jgi:hypothetical protein